MMRRYTLWWLIMLMITFGPWAFVQCTKSGTTEAPHHKGNAWTIMLYLDADNDLEDYAIMNAKQIKDGFVNNQGLNVVVLVDRIPGYSTDAQVFGENFTGTRLYEMSHNTAKRLDDPVYLGLGGQGDTDELDMGDANTLKKFVQFCKANYTANNYALILWNHGGGPRKSVFSMPGRSVAALADAGPEKTICVDDTSGGTVIYTAEITDVLGAAESVDLLGFDACFMGSAEIAYQYRPGNGGFNAQVMVASAPTEWGPGWAYDKIFSRLRSCGGDNGQPDVVVGGMERYHDPNVLTPLELGGVIVESHYQATQGQYAESMSCYDLSRAGAVKNAVDALAISLGAGGSTAKSSFNQMRGDVNTTVAAMHYFDEYSADEWYAFPFFDVYDIGKRIHESTDPGFSAAHKADANVMMSAVDEMIVYSFACPYYQNFVNGKNGLSIFAPDGEASFRTSRYWAYQWWYNAIDTRSVIGPTYQYGKLSWCIDNATPGDSAVTSWFELLDSWYDTINDATGGLNKYQY